MGRPPKRKAADTATGSLPSNEKKDGSTKVSKKQKVETTATPTGPNQTSPSHANGTHVTRSLSNGTKLNALPYKSSPKAKQVDESSTPKKAIGRPRKNQSQVPKTSSLSGDQDLINGDTQEPPDLSAVSSFLSKRAKEKTKTKSNAIDWQSDDEADADGHQYWLMKAEPESRIEKGKDVKFSIDDLQAATSPEPWDGVRNLEARNNMRAMTKGDLAFFYHSNCKVPGIVGTMEIVQEHTVDGKCWHYDAHFQRQQLLTYRVESAFDPEHPYYDEKSNRESPKWHVVHVAFRQKFTEIIKLKDMQKFSKERGQLEEMQTLKRKRLSVSKVSKKEWDFIMSLVDGDEEDVPAAAAAAGSAEHQQSPMEPDGNEDTTAENGANPGELEEGVGDEAETGTMQFTPVNGPTSSAETLE